MEGDFDNDFGRVLLENVCRMLSIVELIIRVLAPFAYDHFEGGVV